LAKKFHMLSSKAQKVINHYLNLPFQGVDGVRCPYFINKRLTKRGALRVLIGKGAPKEIVEEAKIISIQYHHGVFDHDGHCCIHGEHLDDKKEEAQNIRKFLIDNQLGVDCSALVTYILRAHFEETKGIDIAQKIISNIPTTFARKLIMKLRPIESIGVRSGYYNENNTLKLGDETTGYDFSKIQAGDVIVILETGPNNTRNHIILITDCDGQKIQYIHSRAWSVEGQYGHGVNTGEIKITYPGKGLLAQQWLEKSQALTEDLFNQNQPNETYLEAKNAKILEIRRFKI